MRLRAALLVIALTCAAPAWADCASEYYRGAAPRVTQSTTLALRELCYDDFAIGHSGVTHTPLWSAEHLTMTEVDEARALSRHDAFHADGNLPHNERAELADYRRSGFDRGHMAPSGDMPTPEAQAQSFTLANMAPQAPSLNRGLWEEIEVATRDLAEQDGEVFVVTGPIFGDDSELLNGRVRVPRAMFKAIYDPQRRAAGAYVADNIAGADYRVVSIAELRAMIGFDVFPSLPASMKLRPMDLPLPQRRQAPSEHVASTRLPSAGRILTAFTR